MTRERTDRKPPGDKAPNEDCSDSEHHVTRFKLIWDVLLFQFKLLADGVRDLLLSPLSIGAALLGLFRGGNQPDQYFRRLQRFGRRSDVLINLFNQHRRGNTADKLVEPLEKRLTQGVAKNPWFSKQAKQVNRALDQVNRGIKPGSLSPADRTEEDRLHRPNDARE